MENKKQRYFSTTFWSDKWVRGLDPMHRYLYVYLVTSPETNIAGVYKTTSDKMAYDTGIIHEKVREGLKEFEAAGKAYFFKDEWVIIPSWAKHQRFGERGTLRDGAMKILQSLDGDVFEFIKKCGYDFDLSDIKREEIVHPPHPPGDFATEPKPPASPEPTPQKKAKRFKPPAPEQVAAYAEEKGYTGFDTQRFMAHHISAGWVVGKKKMVDWKGAVVTWHLNDEKFSKKGDPGAEIMGAEFKRFGECIVCKEWKDLVNNRCEKCREES